MKRFVSMVIFLSLVPAAMFATDVKSDFDRDVNLSNIRTFRFADRPSGELADKRMRNAIRESFTNVGLDEANGQPDVWIVYYAGIQQKTRIHTSGYGRPAWWGVQSAWTEDYTDATAVVDFLDAETGELIWRGKVTGSVTLNNAEQRTKEGMDRLANAYRKDRERQARRH